MKVNWVYARLRPHSRGPVRRTGCTGKFAFFLQFKSYMFFFRFMTFLFACDISLRQIPVYATGD